jgi:hypothetical protein
VELTSIPPIRLNEVTLRYAQEQLFRYLTPELKVDAFVARQGAAARPSSSALQNSSASSIFDFNFPEEYVL